MCTHFGRVTKIKTSLNLHLRIIQQNNRLPVHVFFYRLWNLEMELRIQIQIISLKQGIEFEFEIDSETKFRIRIRTKVWKPSLDFEFE